MRKGVWAWGSSASIVVLAFAATSAAAQTAEPPASTADKEAGMEADTVQAANETNDEIIVTGFRSSLQKGLSLKREAVGIRDSIVAEDIGKFPEQNVAESLQRIPGVYMTRDGGSNEGQRISIRGLGTQYSVTTINGAPVHTTSSGNVGSSTRDFNFDVFPSELFGRVDVYKTPLANLEEGGIAGNVDLQTPRPFDNSGRVLRYSAAANYNTQSKRWTPRGSLLLSQTFGNFGALFGIAYAENVNTRSGFQSTGGYNSSALGMRGFDSPPAPINTTGPFPFQLNFNDPRANLGGLTQAQVANAYLPRFFRVYTSRNERSRLGMVGSLQYKTSRLDLSVDGIYSHLTDNLDEFTFGAAVRNSRTVAGTTSLPGRGTNSGLVPIDVKIDQYNNLYGTFANATYLGESFFRNAATDFKYVIGRGAYDITDRLKLSAQANYSESLAWYSANRVLVNLYGVTARFDPTGNVTYPTISTPVDVTNPRNFADATLGFSLSRETDREKTARALLEWRAPEFGSLEFTFRAGGSRVSTVKQLSQQDGSSIASKRTLPNGQTFATLDVFSYMNPYLQNGRIADGGNAGFPSNWATFPRTFVMDFLDANGANRAAPLAPNATFRAEEIVTAAFAESDFKTNIAGHELRGNVGMRYADTRTLIDNFVSAGSGVFMPGHREGGYHNWLPSASLAFDVTPKLVLRGSAGKTLTRQALAIIAASTRVPNVFDPSVTVGNPDLKPQVSTQFDTSLEWYFAPGGLLSAAAFKKRLTGNAMAVTDIVRFDSLGLPQSAFNALAILGSSSAQFPADYPIRRTVYINQGVTKLNGLEFAYQQSFRFLPKPFDGLGTIISYTRVNTQGNDYITSKGTHVPISFVPKNILSLTGYYEKGPLALRASYNYRSKTGQTSTNNGNDQIPYNAAQGFLDASFSYKISQAFELRIDAQNLTNVNSYVYYENPDQPAGNGSTRRDNSYFNGRTLSIGLRGRF